MAESDDRMELQAKAILFGFPSTPVALSIRPRSPSWRASGAAVRMGGFAVLAGAAAVVPPHAPWLIGALVVGAIMARRRWIERYTLERIEGICPKCGTALKVRAGRLRTPHPVPCDGCHHESSVSIDRDALDG